jgi:uncharacterized protein
MSSPLSETAEGLRLALRVTPRAGRNEIGTVRNGRLQVRVTVAPEDGKANEAVIRLLSKSWRIAAGSIELVSGHTSRDKVLLLRGIHVADVPL